MVSDQSLDDRNHGIIGVGDAEDDLVASIVELERGA